MLFFLLFAILFALNEFTFSCFEFVFCGSLTCGTTWHAAGLLGKLRSTAIETKLSSYSVELYSRLEDETGVGSGKEISYQNL